MEENLEEESALSRLAVIHCCLIFPLLDRTIVEFLDNEEAYLFMCLLRAVDTKFVTNSQPRGKLFHVYPLYFLGQMKLLSWHA